MRVNIVHNIIYLTSNQEGELALSYIASRWRTRAMTEAFMRKDIQTEQFLKAITELEQILLLNLKIVFVEVVL